MPEPRNAAISRESGRALIEDAKRWQRAYTTARDDLALLEATLDSLEAILFGDTRNRSRDELEARAEELVRQGRCYLEFVNGKGAS